jgi:hypothetical protein
MADQAAEDVQIDAHAGFFSRSSRTETGMLSEADRLVAKTTPAKSAASLLGRFRAGVLSAPAPVILLTAVLIAMFANVPGIRPANMTDTGLVSVLPLGWFVELGLLIVSFGLAMYDEDCPQLVRTAHVVGFIVLIHGTPDLVYGTLRYSWAWKHLGVVDYIGRTGTVNTRDPLYSPYYNWPGFFTLFSLATKFAGAKSALAFASWAPVYFNLLLVAPLKAFFGAFTTDRRVVTLACWLFFIGSWIGQDYFAPQALNFILYIVVLVLWLRVLDPNLSYISAASHRAAMVLMVLLQLVIASSHQLTPFMMTLALIVLVVYRRGRGWRIAASSAVVSFGWVLTGARTFVLANLRSVLDNFGTISQNANSTMIDLARVSEGQLIVAQMGRALSAAMVLLAVIGVVRLRKLRPMRVPLILLATPVAMLAASSYGGEIVFRVYLFALPPVAFFAASALAPKAGIGCWTLRRSLLLTAVSIPLITGLLFAHYGGERQYHFTHQEVAGSEWLYANAPSGSLVIGVTSNMPWGFGRYEEYRYRWLGAEDDVTRSLLVTDPRQAVDEAIEAKPGVANYVVLNRGQKAQVEANGVLPIGAIDTMRSTLIASGEFTVAYQNPDMEILIRVQR